MKSIERQKLKQNEFARTMARVQEGLTARRGVVIQVLLAALVAVAALAVVTWWRESREAGANTMLAAALATYETPVVAPPPPAPGSPPPVPQPGTFQSDQQRFDAALPQFLEAADAHPGSQAGITARFHAAAILAAQGKHAEAEAQYRGVIERAGGSIYGRTARLGLAESLVAQQQYDEAIQIYTRVRDEGSTLPVEGVLMQLGRASLRAGRHDEAVQAFTRVVDEFPLSPYAAEARRELEEAKRAAPAASAGK